MQFLVWFLYLKLMYPVYDNLNVQWQGRYNRFFKICYPDMRKIRVHFSSLCTNTLRDNSNLIERRFCVRSLILSLVITHIPFPLCVIASFYRSVSPHLLPLPFPLLPPLVSVFFRLISVVFLQTLEYDRDGLSKMRKAIKAIHNSGNCKFIRPVFFADKNYITSSHSHSQ